MKNKAETDLVGHIAGFTSLRDVDLLEMSLLKSIYTTLRPISVSIITLDVNNIVLKRVDYSADEYSRITSKQEADEFLLQTCEQLDNSTKKYCTISENNKCMTLFLLDQTRRISQYVCIESMGNVVTQADSFQIIGMLQVFQNFRAVLNEAQTDELTGLPNRKAFTHATEKVNEIVMATPETIENEQREHKRSASNFWLALADIDNFKSINDTFGHLMGDEVLVRVAQCMQSSIREEDMVFRYGGEEFAILIYAESEAQVKGALERIRRNIEAIDFQKLGVVTVSIGFTEMKEGTFTLTLVETADKAMYESKQRGKNTITYKAPEEFNKQVDNESDIELF